MRLKTPDFWYDTKDPVARAKAMSLSVLTAFYALGHVLHQHSFRKVRAGIPVLCVGNLVAGGGGKTPVAMAVMSLVLRERIFKNPCFLSRGYGGKNRGPVLVDPLRHHADDVGDEPLLLAAAAPVIIAADRAAGAAYARAQGFDAIVMDDGLQNPGLRKDFSVVVIDGMMGFGNEMLLPAGPLRTPITTGLRGADAVVIIGDDLHHASRHIPSGKPILRAVTIPVTPLDTLPDYVAFCGIANPSKFWATLEQAELKIAEFYKFSDHYPYKPGDLETLAQRAQALKARLVTTAKDAARLPPEFLSQNPVDILAIAIEWQDESAAMLETLIRKVVTT